MKCRLVAAGTRLPEWVRAGFEDYQRRLKGPIAIELHEIPIAPRGGGMSVRRAMQREEQAMLAALKKDDFLVAMQIEGRAMSTQQLARWLQARMRAGGNVAFMIGGPDGLSDACGAKAELSWSLSALTFPHALVRVIVAEQLYRAATLIAGHPYHRG